MGEGPLKAMAGASPGGRASQTGPSQAKRLAGEAAAAHVKDGMVLGLGTGSTVRYTVDAIGRMVQAGLNVLGVATSVATENQARSLGIKLTTLDEHPELDLAIDGTDEFDPQLRLIKGGGGALTREKIVATQAARFVVVADERKRVPILGSTFALPVEVIALGRTPVRRLLEDAGAAVGERPDYRTDNGNPILDARFNAIQDPEALEQRLEAHPAVVCCGLFLGMCDEVILSDGKRVETVFPVG